jgi:nucleotide-binding universal stress UspA family protein
MFRHVLVGVDGGNGGRDAVALAQRLVDPDGRVTLGHVHGGILSRLPTVTLWNEGQVEDAESVLRAEQRAAGGVVEVGVASIGAHSPGEGLHRLAERTGADLLVIGVSHHRAAGRALIGDNARSVLNGAPCAVAVAPHDYREHPDPIARLGVGYDGSPSRDRSPSAPVRRSRRSTRRTSPP